MKLSIVVPVFNEATTIRDIIQRIIDADTGLAKELILVDDGSTDGTRALYDEIQQEHKGHEIHLLLHECNQGKGAALRTGFQKATGDIILVQDADLEYDPKEYPKLIAPILDGRADVVYGSRFVGGDAHRVLFFWHMLGNRFLTLLSNAFTNLNLTDMETCYKVFRSEVIQNLTIKSNRFEFEPEITSKIARSGYRVYEVGISYAGREYAEGKKITWIDGIKAILAIIRYRFFD